jgi:esterase/lipase superfamily enzyme
LAHVKNDHFQDAPALLFEWLSAGDRPGYANDGDAPPFARDDSVQIMPDLSQRNDRAIAVPAHAMGPHLETEAMRLSSLTDQRRGLDRIVWMSYVAPDFEPDGFRRQAEVIGELLAELFVVLANRDQAIRLSTFSAGGRARVGGLRTVDQLAGPDATVFDRSDMGSGSRDDYDEAFDTPRAIEALANLDTCRKAPSDGAPEYHHLGQRVRRDPNGP